MKRVALTALIVASVAAGVVYVDPLSSSTSVADSRPQASAGTPVDAVPIGVSGAEWDLLSCYPDISCATELLVRQVVAEGGRATMDNIQTVSSSWPMLVANCHALSHEIGIAAGDQLGSETAFTDGSPHCQFGYYHGVLIGEAENLGDNEAFAQRAPELCQILDTDFLSYSSCVHGIGHAAAVRAGNLPEGVAMCGGLTAEERVWCVSGVAMEWSTTVAVDQARSGLLSKEQMRRACAELEVGDQESCYREMPGGWIAGFRVPFAEMLTWCVDDPVEEKASLLCALGVGFSLAARSDGDPVVIEEQCALAPSETVAAYCSGGAAVIAFEMFESFDEGRAYGVCPNMPESWQATCEAHLAQTVEAYANRQ